jgi:hypothetical protein
MEATGDPSDAYKFKSNITHRFSLQDSALDLPAESAGSMMDGGKGRPPGDAAAAAQEFDTGESSSSHHGIKLEGEDHRRSSSGGRARSVSNSSGNEPTGGGGMLPVIRERLQPLPPLPGFPPPDSRDLSASTMSAGGKPPPPPMELLMPTLAPIQPTGSPSRAAPPPPVPIFALNAKGSYYVPMSVDLSVIAPFMALYTEETYSVLHPVTISVNFQVS